MDRILLLVRVLFIPIVNQTAVRTPDLLILKSRLVKPLFRHIMARPYRLMSNGALNQHVSHHIYTQAQVIVITSQVAARVRPVPNDSSG